MEFTPRECSALATPPALPWIPAASMTRSAITPSSPTAPRPTIGERIRTSSTTNSLGFRDKKIREVPLTDPRPRILILGDSFAEGKVAWSKSFVGRIADHFPQYDFLNSGLAGYSPSNYLTTAQMVLDKGYRH